MAEPKHLIESLLFITAHPLTAKKLAELTGVPLEDVAAALGELMDQYNQTPGGIQLNKLGQSYQLTTTPTSAKIVQAFLEEEEKKELTKPSLEALTIIAYRGPIAKTELELIRGVNCSLILRNLLIRGLIEEAPDPEAMTLRYRVTFDFLHYLGIRETRELPDFEKLNANENLEKLLRASTSDDGDEEEKSAPEPAATDTEELVV